jgi:hypothetical protein
MFFLGLLSTPLPYLLLAAFYFFGFAMGVFNNKTDEEPKTQVAAVTIPADIKEVKADHAVHYYQVNVDFQSKISKVKGELPDHSAFVPDTSPDDYFSLYYLKAYDSSFIRSLFSRPPPSVC